MFVLFHHCLVGSSLLIVVAFALRLRWLRTRALSLDWDVIPVVVVVSIILHASPSAALFDFLDKSLQFFGAHVLHHARDAPPAPDPLFLFLPPPLLTLRVRATQHHFIELDIRHASTALPPPGRSSCYSIVARRGCEEGWPSSSRHALL